jgi:hypothetical protein
VAEAFSGARELNHELELSSHKTSDEQGVGSLVSCPTVLLMQSE